MPYKDLNSILTDFSWLEAGSVNKKGCDLYKTACQMFSFQKEGTTKRPASEIQAF